MKVRNLARSAGQQSNRRFAPSCRSEDFFLASAATAQTPSVETAAKAAGLPVKSATANVNQIDLYYRDVGAGDQTVILLHHGFPETGDALAPAVAALGAR